MATASDKGTVIRVFSVPNGEKVFQFRRGSYSARIFSISFNAVSTLLAVSSDTDTVHIFKLVSRGHKAGANPRKPGGLSTRSLSTGDVPDAGAEDDDASITSSSGGRYQGAGLDGNGPSGKNPQLGGYEAYIENKRGTVGTFGYVCRYLWIMDRW